MRHPEAELNGLPLRMSNSNGAVLPKRGHGLAEMLSALTLIALPFGSAFTISLYGGHLPITWSELVIIPLVSHAVNIRSDRIARFRLMAMLCVGGLLLFPIIIAPAIPLAIATYFSFASGVIGGFTIGWVWSLLDRTKFNFIDFGVYGCAAIVSLQLVTKVSGLSQSLAHVGATTDIGGSNYIAGILAVLTFAVVGRLRAVEAPASSYVPLALPVIAIVQTLSRGGIVALVVGACVLLWQRTIWQERTADHRFMVRRILIVALPFLLYSQFTRIVSIRGNSANLDVSSRFDLYRIAWQGFLKSPLFGQGWASFRISSFAGTGTSQSFAHNLVLSFLQIGGLLSLPFLVIIVRWTFMAAKRRPEMLPAIAAGITISMTDPFFEGFAGALIMWMVLYPAPLLRPAAKPDRWFS